MKNTALLCCCAIVLVVASAASSGERYRIGYLCSNLDDTFQVLILEAAREAALEAGIEFFEMDAGEDVLKQQDQFDSLARKGVDAFLVVPVNPYSVTPLVAKARRHGKPLVFINRNPYPDDAPPENVYYIGSNSFVEGETQIHYAGEQLGGSGNIVILVGILTNEASQNRTRGVRHAIRTTYPDIAILSEESGNWQRSQGEAITKNWLMAFGDKINAVISNNDEMALGALEALTSVRLADDVLVVGIDAIPAALHAIDQGLMNATVKQDPVAQGRGAVEIAVKAITGQRQGHVFILPSTLITKENVAEYLPK
ncbi:MAG: substrate-binding domain-containing protein [Planctomycetes bacterium]|nr:substrate-binding domain-containing protein [Planctomycetota bacterium]